MTRLSGYLGTRPKSRGRRQGRALSSSTAYLQQSVGEGIRGRGAPPKKLRREGVTAFHGDAGWLAASGWLREA